MRKFALCRLCFRALALQGDIGAVLDRNGLRPSRYVVTKDGLLAMASEVGVVDIDFLVVPSGDDFRVNQAIVHKADGEKRTYHVEQRWPGIF